MEVASSVLGTYTIVFKDAAIDHAYGESLCDTLRMDNRVERASHYSDYDSQKIELVMASPSMEMKIVLKDAILNLLETVHSMHRELL